MSCMIRYCEYTTKAKHTLLNIIKAQPTFVSRSLARYSWSPSAKNKLSTPLTSMALLNNRDTSPTPNSLRAFFVLSEPRRNNRHCKDQNQSQDQTKNTTQSTSTATGFLRFKHTDGIRLCSISCNSGNSRSYWIPILKT